MKKDVLSPEKLLPYSQKDNHVVYSLINPRKCLSSKAKSKIIFWQFQDRLRIAPYSSRGLVKTPDIVAVRFIEPISEAGFTK